MAQASETRRSSGVRSTSSRKLVFALGLLCALLGGLVFAMTPSASAAGNPAPITDYENYPIGIIPDSCPVDGGAILTGVQFVSSKAPADPKASLVDLDIDRGSTITMTWTSFHEGCGSTGISLAAKATQHSFFEPSDDQKIVSFDYCQDDSAYTPCSNGGGFGPLVITVPSDLEACNYQIDAVIGPPLADVGPNGSYYGSLLREQQGKPNGGASGDNMLIASVNGGNGKCTVPPEASATMSCTLINGAPGVDVAVTNPDDDDIAHVDVFKGATKVGDNVAVPTLDEAHVQVPFAAGETATVSVVDKLTDATVFSDDFTADCLDVNGTATMSCANGGVDISLTNAKAGIAHVTVTVDGTSTNYDVTTGSPVHFTVPVAEDHSVVITITDNDAETTLVDHKTFTADCVEAQGEVQETTTTSTSTPDSTTAQPDTVLGEDAARGTTLARTGAGGTVGMTTLAGLLLMVGGVLMALANRPLPGALTANTRSRGR